MIASEDALTPEEVAAVGEAVREAERATAGEIVPVLATVSSDYPVACGRAALTGTVLGLVALWLLWPEEPGDWHGGRPPLPAALFGLGLGALVLWTGARLLPDFRRLWVFRSEEVDAVEHGAARAFRSFRVHRTARGTGVVLYVSLHEGLVAVRGDGPISEKLNDEDWAEVRDLIVDAMRQGNAARGLVEGVHRIGEHLARHFPIAVDDVNELGNELRLL